MKRKQPPKEALDLLKKIQVQLQEMQKSVEIEIQVRCDGCGRIGKDELCGNCKDLKWHIEKRKWKLESTFPFLYQTRLYPQLSVELAAHIIVLEALRGGK